MNDELEGQLAARLDEFLIQLLESSSNFLSELTPEGFKNSPYYLHYHKDEEYFYLIYRRARANRYLWIKQRNSAEAVPPLLSFEQYIEHLYPSEKVQCLIPDEIMGILCEKTYSLGTSSSLLLPYGTKVGFGEIEDFDEVITRILPFCSVKPEKPFSFKSWNYHPYSRLSKVNFYKVYVHIFKVLKNAGLNWQYSSTYIKYLIGLQRELEEKKEDKLLGRESDEDHMHETIASFLKLGERDEETGELIYPDLANAFQEYQTKEPSEEVLAYKEVFGKFPSGYPPQISDYL